MLDVGVLCSRSYADYQDMYTVNYGATLFLSYFSFFLIKSCKARRAITVKLDFKELLIKEQIDFKELFTEYRPFYTINLLLNKELLLT